ncbi:TM0106 family RecB-like putative nuclease [Amnibacterium sp.]|uniref:TM0106 family RecB-like putative nuclease n=1 Tax=Amnibacterium sp. TaxID=1872496 RepID=UPI003F7BE63C
MFLLGGAVVLSATDLTNATECEWAVLRRLDAKLGRALAVPDPVDALRDRAARLGDAHEARQLDEYRRQRGAAVVEIPRPDDARDPVALAAAQERTLAAIRDRAEVVFQATLFDGAFLGFADFLVRTGDVWEVYDTKLARRAKVTALMQLAAYAGRLQALGVPVGEHVHLLLGDGTTSTHRLADVAPVFEERMARLRTLVDERVAAPAAIAWGAEGVAACGRCAECTAQVEATRDVLLVGRLTVRQRERLRAAGLPTIEAFAASTGPVEGIAVGPLQRLRLQARLQLEADGGTGVLARVIDREGLAALPERDPGDVFFDFEGDPLWSDDGRTWGLEYLFGVVELDDAGRERFRPFWAHDRAAEKEALLGFLEYVRARRAAHPGMHVYHYADYERSHLQQLCARHGVGEAVLDELLREHVLVDLYPVVLRSVRISERSYSLKKLEPLYMGDRLRQSDVTTGAGSVDAYVEYRRLVDAGSTDEAAAVLREIADYNEYDCASTRGLRDWLLRLADERGVARRPPLPEEPERDAALGRQEDEVRDALLARIADVPRADRTPDQTSLALAAAAIEYHRREDKTFWWEHYNRQIAPIEDWADQKDVLVVELARVARDWAQEGRQVSATRVIELVGRLAPGSGLGPGDTQVFVMYDAPPPAGCDPVPAGQRGEHGRGSVLETRLLPDGRTLVVLEEQAGRRDGVAIEPWQDLPVALTPKAPIWTRNQRAAILEWGTHLVAGFPAGDAVLDLLRRTPPRLAGGGTATAPADPTAAAIAQDVLRLDRSSLAVQGPPGAGKTHVGAEVIAALVRDHGWRVGVVAQSHAVVENLLDRVVAAGLPADRVGKRLSSAGTVGDWTAIEPNRPVGVKLWTGARRDGGYVLGGTAWTFSDAQQVERKDLDLLVVDEAGQFSLANTVAVGVSARNLLLLGDPQQLPQVSQGLHPEAVDTSALGWLSDGHDVLPAEFGVFLPETWRMHPVLTRAVSDLAYEGRLRARLPETAERSLEGVQPGLHPVAVAHPGDTVESRTEADAVLRLVHEHLGRIWTDPSHDRDREPLEQEDLIVVAPFNAQVALLRGVLDAEGLSRVRVGTVDRFQGQEAVIAIVSLTASSAADVPRGIGFVLGRNRMNVAISRARWAAYLVHSPALADAVPSDPAGVAELAGFLRLTR